MFVKICGITNEDDALLATALGADAFGFVFAPSTRQVHAGRRARHREAACRRTCCPSACSATSDPSTSSRSPGASGCTPCNSPGSEPLSEVRWIRERVRFVIQGFAAGDPALGAAANSPADVVLVDSPSPGSGKVFDWRLAEGAPGGVRLMIAGGLTPENVGEAIRLVRPWGVDVATGVEARPGPEGSAQAAALHRSCARAAGDEGDDPYASLTEPRGDVDDGRRASPARGTGSSDQ